MKKIIVGLLVIVNLMAINASAAWEFEEKIIDEAYGAQVHFENEYSHEFINTYEYRCVGNSREGFSGEYDYQFFDFDGNEITRSDTRKEIKEDSKTENTQENKINYFTNNQQSILIKDKNRMMKLVDLDRNVLAEDFEVGYDWDKTDIARKVLKDGLVGIMAYDGRIIVPVEYRDVKLYQSNLYVAVGKGEKKVYNYDGEIVFTLPDGYQISEMGMENWMSVSRTVEGQYHKEYALIDYDGNIIIDYGDYEMRFFSGPSEWQSGEFVQINPTNSADEKYLNRQLEEIDLFSLDSVYCKSYEEFSDTVIIFNHYMDKEYKYQMRYALYDKTNKKYIIPYQEQKLEKNGEYILQWNKVLDQYGNLLFEVENNKLLSDFKDGIAEIGINSETKGCRAFCDQNGRNIFGRNYSYAERIDNNEFLVRDDRTIKILTAKGIIGEALNTDVKIDINGYQIPCYSAYGYAVIKAEDLRYFGFDVEWNGEERMLYISRNPQYHDITAGDFGESGETGTHYADIHGSDINVEYNSKRLSSYCINGVTLIKPEDLETEGITFNYDNSKRTLFMTVAGLEQK